MANAKKPSGVEGQKEQSRRLRGDVAEALSAPEAPGGISETAHSLVKFHGFYEQYDRDTATVRKQRGEDKEWQFMIRVRPTGGAMTAEQYLTLDALADRHSNGTLRITTRASMQFHGVLRENVKTTVAEVNHALLTTMAACGDVVRQVMASPAPVRDAAHARVLADARMLAAALMPKTRAYHEIFLDEERVAGSGEEEEPLYGATYLPRKFKIAIAQLDENGGDNSVDVLSNDLGFIAVFEKGALQGYQVCIGGGQGMTHNRADTYPRLATPIAFVGPDDLLRAAEAVVRYQRDHGDRSDRRRARLKYVLDDRGVDTVREELAAYWGGRLPAPRDLPRLRMPELLGWQPQGDGRWWLGVPVPSGRIQDTPDAAIRSALREVVQRFGADPVFTPQQDVLLTNLPEEARAGVDAVLRAHGVTPAEDLTPLARWALACPALPTCGLALTEAERVRAPLVAQIEAAMARHGLEGERVSLRITGCPNGCARPYSGDIGLVGRVPGKYAIFLGGDFEGTRLSYKFLERVPEDEIGATLEPLFAAFAAQRRPGEGFGDFAHRLGPDAALALAGRAAPAAA